MKGILLCGGHGTRLHPVTKAVSKQLLPVYDKPMVYYPLSTLMLAGVRDILIISTPQDLPAYEALLGSGKDLGIRLSYAVQPSPRGIADALLVGRDFIGQDDVALILGDNLFFAQGLQGLLRSAARDNPGATIFGYLVKDPGRYGVAELDETDNVVELHEKPENPPSPYAVTGLYFYDNEAVQIAETLKPSSRGEIEITELNRTYLRAGRLRFVKLGRGAAWLDTGTHQSLLEAANFIATIENRQGLKVACLEEVAYRMGFIDDAALDRLAKDASDPELAAYLQRLLPGAQRDQPRTVRPAEN